MSRRPYAGSVFWGLALVAAGAVLLARNIGYDIPIWTGIATYWPVLLILWGGAKIVDYIRIRRRGEDRPLFSPGEVVLLIFIMFAGVAISATTHLSPAFVELLEVADIDLWQITGNEYDYTEHYESDAPPGSDIEIVNRYGSVEVIPAEVDRITVDVRKTIVAETQEDADQLSEVLTFSIREEPPGFRIVSTFNRDENTVRGRRFRTSLTVRVPMESNLRIDNRNGDVSLSGLRGDQAISNAFGEVAVRGIEGSLDLNNRNGNVAIESVSGSATIENAFARTEVRNVGGNLAVDTRNGDVDVSDVNGSATIENAFASVRASSILGDLAIRGNNNAVDLENVAGNVEVESAFQDIRIRDVRGRLRVNNRNGDVNVRFSEIPVEDISISTEFSSVTIEVPSGAAFSLDLFTRFGEIESDFGLPVAENGPERSLVASVGSAGPTIRIRTRNGNIRLNRI